MSFTTGLRCPVHGAVHSEAAARAAVAQTSAGSECPCRTFTVRCSLFTAAEWGRLDAIQRRLARSDDELRLVNCEDAAGYTMLHFAAQNGHQDVVSFLLQHGANVDAATCGSTPLHRAAFAGHLGVVQVLVDGFGADVRKPDQTKLGRGQVSIHKAARGGHDDIVAWLLLKDPGLAQLRDARDMTFVQARQAEVQTALQTPDKRTQQVTLGSPERALSHVATGMGCPQCGKHVIQMTRRACCKTLVCETCAKTRCSVTH